MIRVRRLRTDRLHILQAAVVNDELQRLVQVPMIVVDRARVFKLGMQLSFTPASRGYLAQQVVLVGREMRLMQADLVGEVAALTVLKLAVGHLAWCLDATLQWDAAAHHILLEARVVHVARAPVGTTLEAARREEHVVGLRWHVHEVVTHVLDGRLLVMVIVRLRLQAAQRLNFADVAGGYVRLASDLAHLLRELATRLSLHGPNAASERRDLLEVGSIEVSVRAIHNALGILQ